MKVGDSRVGRALLRRGLHFVGRGLYILCRRRRRRRRRVGFKPIPKPSLYPTQRAHSSLPQPTVTFTVVTLL